MNDHYPKGACIMADMMQPSPDKGTPGPSGIEALVCEDIRKRQQLGIAKYGRTLAENPAGRAERIKHAYEEALDLALYLKWELEADTMGDE